MSVLSAQSSSEQKTCRKCNAILPATTEYFYRNKKGLLGLTPRCKICVDEDNKAAHKKKMQENPEHICALARARMKRHYRKDIETSRKEAREAARRARQDPERRARINMRKRAGGAGMTQEEFDALLLKQGGKCAICGVSHPKDATGSNTWNIDHCHKTGRVRFILCCHCNRGLGAFRDSPKLMRLAADLLESFNDSE